MPKFKKNPSSAMTAMGLQTANRHDTGGRGAGPFQMKYQGDHGGFPFKSPMKDPGHTDEIHSHGGDVAGSGKPNEAAMHEYGVTSSKNIGGMDPTQGMGYASGANVGTSFFKKSAMKHDRDTAHSHSGVGAGGGNQGKKIKPKGGDEYGGK